MGTGFSIAACPALRKISQLCAGPQHTGIDITGYLPARLLAWFLLLLAFAIEIPVFTVLPSPGLKGYILPSFASGFPVPVVWCVCSAQMYALMRPAAKNKTVLLPLSCIFSYRICFIFLMPMKALL